MVMITQKIPNGQKRILTNALMELEARLQKVADNALEDSDIHHELFDIKTLKTLLQYEVSVTMTEHQHDFFTGINGIDYPIYVED